MKYNFQMLKLSDQKGETKWQVHAGPAASAEQQLVAECGKQPLFPMILCACWLVHPHVPLAGSRWSGRPYMHV